jgi:hypothetical protein
MGPALAFPFNDPGGTMFHHLQAILSDLKSHFERAYICPPLSTQKHAESIEALRADSFFTIFPAAREMQIGEHFAYLYQRAGQAAPPEQILHLCYLDRLAFALEGEYRELFFTDIDSLSESNVPLIFQRSQKAWDTHPQNYRDLEAMVTMAGHHLFGRKLDYAWCHLVLPAAELRRIMPLVKNRDLSMVAEMIFYLRDHIQTRDVDWLAWEDPFVLSCDPVELKHEREKSLAETNKRLKYVIPMIETLARLSENEGNQS